MTTIATNRNDRLSWKDSGATVPCRLAYRTPETPPRAAPMANAHSLNLKAGTPMIAAASSSSRMASHARPTRLFSRRRTAKTRMNKMTSASQYQR